MTKEDAIAILREKVATVAERNEAIDMAIDALENERPTGEWIKHDFHSFGGLGDWDYKCSKCGKVEKGRTNFCPICGAKMKGGEGE